MLPDKSQVVCNKTVRTVELSSSRQEVWLLIRFFIFWATCMLQNLTPQTFDFLFNPAMLKLISRKVNLFFSKKGQSNTCKSCFSFFLAKRLHFPQQHSLFLSVCLESAFISHQFNRPSIFSGCFSLYGHCQISTSLLPHHFVLVILTFLNRIFQEGVCLHRISLMFFCYYFSARSFLSEARGGDSALHGGGGSSTG